MKKIKIPIYGGNLIIDVVESMEEGFKKYNINCSSYQYEAISIKLIIQGKREYIVLIKENASPGTIAHEAKHTVNNIFGHIGQDLDINNDEAECYLLGWIVNRIHEKLNDYRLKQT